MSESLVERLARALLYEGYILYPYRPSVKNRQRWTFGGLYPRSWSELQSGTDAWMMQTECLVEGERAAVKASIRFLHLMDRTVIDADGREVPVLESGGKRYEPWQEAVERHFDLGEIAIADLLNAPRQQSVFFTGGQTIEMVGAGRIVRRQWEIRGEAEMSATRIDDQLTRLTLRVLNGADFPEVSGEDRDGALMRTLISTHAILQVRDGQFVSLLEPPEKWEAEAKACRNIGVWPVLVGPAPQRDTMLASPIILYDYPQLAPESPGDLFDSTEIDEILTLRILTLTDEEKRCAAAVDERARQLLERTHSLAENQLSRLHGTLRSVEAPGEEAFKIGDRVVLHPLGRADAFDILLDGKNATIVAIEQDREDRIHVAVTIDDDPGSDLGLSGQPGHRFFFGVEEIEHLENRSVGA
ncbi:MAG TPA: hypothetical protein VMD30_09650 [Tepidisphaeraceae bacterium]|nr:hypothetical protein [Tepidisphaeraceae bacterium]